MRDRSASTGRGIQIEYLRMCLGGAGRSFLFLVLIERAERTEAGLIVVHSNRLRVSPTHHLSEHRLGHKTLHQIMPEAFGKRLLMEIWNIK